MYATIFRRIALALVMCITAVPLRAADVTDTIARVKRSVIAIGTFERGARTPSFQFRGTGFAVAGGNLIVTNAHVLPAIMDPARNEAIGLLMPGPDANTSSIREVRRVAVDAGSDLALLRLEGEPLPALKLRDSAKVKEGQDVMITGYPIGAVLGPFAVTHRGMISAITPIAIPQGRAADLNPAVVRRLSSGTFSVFQLDATAYPGSSGSPIYDPVTGDVLGIVNMVFVKATKEAVMSDPSGITYAVPSVHLEALLASEARSEGHK